MLFLALQVILADEDGEVGIPDFEGLDFGTEIDLDSFPYRIRRGFENVARWLLAFCLSESNLGRLPSGNLDQLVSTSG